MSRPRCTRACRSLMLAMLGLLLAAPTAIALPAAQLDPTFNAGEMQRFDATLANRYDEAYGVAVQPNGRILVAGQVSTGSRYIFAVSRFLPSGAPDSSWGGGDGVASTAFTIPTSADAYAMDVLVKPDGKVVAVGYADTGTASGRDMVVAQFTAAGVLDTTFDSNGDGYRYINYAVTGATDPAQMPDAANGVALDSAGRIVLGGSANGNLAVARLAPDANGFFVLDPTFSGDGRNKLDVAGVDAPDAARDVAIGTGDTITLGGIATVGGATRLVLARYRPDGVLDTTLGTAGFVTPDIAAGDEDAQGIWLDPASQRVLVTGTNMSAVGARLFVARYLPDGSPDPAWNGGGAYLRHVSPSGSDDAVRNVVADASGRVLVAGTSQTTTTRKDAIVVRLLADGRADPTWSVDGLRFIPNPSSTLTGVGHAIAMSGTNVVLAGSAYGPNGLETMVARLLGEPLAGTAQAFTGCEHGVIDVGAGRTFATASGTTVDWTTKRTGDAACRTQGSFQLQGAGSSTVRVLRLAVNVTTLPPGEQSIVEASAGGDLFSITIDASGVLRGRVGTAVVTGATIAPGGWHLIELRSDASAATRQMSWRVDGEPEASLSFVGAAAASVSSPTFRGSSAAPAVFDDILVSNTEADYPPGDGQALALGVNGVGSNLPAAGTDFRMQDGSALGATSWMALDEKPATSTDFVRQSVANGTSYAEFGMANTPFTASANGVRGIVAFHAPAVGVDDGRTEIVDAGNVATSVYAGDMGSQATTQYRAARVTTPTATWTPAQVNGLRARIGFSTDVLPEPSWDAVLTEIDVPVNISSVGVAVRAPAVSANPRQGTVATVTAASWTGAPTSFAFQWQRCDATGGSCAPIAGATAQSYTPVAADVNSTLRVIETATWRTGTKSSTSAVSAAVRPVPTIIDNQPGDATWRAANVAAYAVSFSDVNGLQRFEVAVWPSPGQVGTARQGWTQAGTLTGTASTASWALPSSTWAALAEGTSNWVSVRVTNTAGETTTLVDAFQVAKDTTGPAPVTSLSAASPTATAPALGWTSVPDAGSGLASWRVYRGATATALSVLASATAPSFTDASAISGARYYYRVGAVDAVGNESPAGSVVEVIYNRPPAMPTLVAPADGALGVSSTPTLRATFTDPDAQPGNVQFQLCSDAACTTPVAAGTSPTVASGATASWTSTGLLAGRTYWWRALATDGLASSALTATRSFTTTSSAPSIIDNQPGDTVWRTSNSGSYDVDFSDAVQLVNFEVNVWSAPGGPAGSGSQLQAWYPVTSLSGTYQNDDWTLPDAVWSNLGPGVNYVSVRVTNSAVVTTTLVDAFEVRIDTTPPPPVTDLAGPIATVVAPTIGWSAVTDATSAVAYYRVFGAPTSSGPWTQLNADGDTTGTAWSDPAPAPNTTSYYMVRAVDRAGLTSPAGNAIAVRPHRAPDTPIATSPADAAAGVSRTPSLDVTYADPDGDAGRVQYEVCADSDCTSILRTGSSALGLPSGSPASWAVSPPLPAASTFWWRSRSIDVWDAVSQDAPARSFTTSSGPAIADSQPGADTWRSANDGRYDIDVSDPLGIDRFEVRVFDAPGQPGTPLRDWTDVASALAGTSYVADWALPAAIWSAIPDGEAYVTVRAWNDEGIASTLEDAIVVRRDSLAAAPSGVIDGAGVDQDWSTSTSSLPLEWTDGGGEANRSGVDRYEYCIATGAGCTGTVARPWSTAGNSLSIDAIGLALVDGANYVASVRTVDLAGNVSAAASSDGIRIDVSAPTGTIDATPSSPWSGTVRITGTASDAGSGLATISVAYAGPESGSMTDAECAAATPASWTETNPANPGCDWNTATVPDGSYLLSAVLVDALGTPTTVTRSVTVDNSPPTITDLRFVEGAQPDAQHPVDCVQPCAPRLWYRPGTSGTVDLVVAGGDAGTGISSVAWPDIDGGAATGWTPAAGLTTSSASPWTRTYAWTATALPTSPLQLQLTDVAGNTTTAQLDVLADSNPPTGASVSSSAGIVNDPVVSFSAGSDLQSGLGTHRLERRSTPRAGATGCDAAAWSAWTAAGPAGVTSPWLDPAAPRGACVEYRLVVVDNVGNSATAADTTPTMTPAPSIVVTATDGTSTAVERGAGDTYAVSLQARPTADVVLTLVGDGQSMPSPTTLTFTATDWSTPRPVTFTAVDDDIDELPDVMSSTNILRAASSDPGYDGLRAQLDGTVTDNDVAGLDVEVADAPTVTEGGDTERIRVRLTTRPVAEVIVALAGDADVRSAPGTLRFTPTTWNTWQAATVAAVDDTLAERTPHAGRLRLTSTGDTTYAALPASLLALRVRDDDPARLVTSAGRDWTATADGRLRLQEGGASATLVVRAVGDPAKDLVITPLAAPEGEVRVTPESARIPAGSHAQAITFEFTATDDGSVEDAVEAGRIAWRISTTDPLYDAATIPAIGIDIADITRPAPTPTPDTGTPNPPQAADPAPSEPAPPRRTPTPGPRQPAGETVASDGSGDGSPPLDTGTPDEAAPRPAPVRTRSAARRVKDWAGDHPLAAGAAASVGGSALLAAKPLALAGKGLAGQGFNLPNGIEELKRLVKRNKSRPSFWHRFSLRRRKRRDDSDDDDGWPFEDDLAA